MRNPLSLNRWSPYLVGAGIGVLSWFSFATADKPLDITTAFEYTTALAESAAAPDLVQSYLAKQSRKDREPKIDWEWLLVLGVFLGAYVSSKMSGDRRAQERVPPLWRWRFGDRPLVRYGGAFAGGFIMMAAENNDVGANSGISRVRPTSNTR